MCMAGVGSGVSMKSTLRGRVSVAVIRIMQVVAIGRRNYIDAQSGLVVLVIVGEWSLRFHCTYKKWVCT